MLLLVYSVLLFLLCPWGFVFGSCFVIQYFVSFLVLPAEEKRMRELIVSLRLYVFLWYGYFKIRLVLSCLPI